MITLITNGAPTHEYGVKSLAGYLQANDIPVRVVYMNYCAVLHKQLQKQILDIVRDSDLVGFSLMTKDVGLFMPVIRNIRLKLKIPLVFGGVHPTALPKESLKFCDYVCIGEGEEPLKQLYSAIKVGVSLSEIPNLVYKSHDGAIVTNPVTYFVPDMDKLPYPDYKFETSYYYNQIRIEKITSEVRSNCFDSFYFYSQRGCKLACAYCSNSIYSKIAKDADEKWCRMASAVRVIDELKLHLEHFPNVKNITFNDDDFLARNIEEIKAITGFVKKELKVTFSINGIPAFVTEEKIKLLVENGLKGIAFGVQSGSPRILKNIYKRPVTPERVLQAANVVSRFYQQGLRSDYGFILDNPYELEDEWLQTLSLIRSLPKPRSVSLYSLQFFPGTALTNQAIQDMTIANEQFEDYGKDYRADIAYSFKNTVYFLYSYFDIPNFFSMILLSKLVLYSSICAPIRFVFAYPFGYLVRMSGKVALANREVFLPIKILKRNWVLRTIKYRFLEVIR